MLFEASYYFLQLGPRASLMCIGPLGVHGIPSEDNRISNHTAEYSKQEDQNCQGEAGILNFVSPMKYTVRDLNDRYSGQN